MNKQKPSRAKYRLFSIISFVLLIIGVGCIVLAAAKIRPSAITLPDANISVSPLKTDVEAAQNELASAETNPMATAALPDTTDGYINLYPVYPVEGDVIGSLSIPALDLELPVIQGTGKDDLKKGVGHYDQSVLPGEKDNCVLSGHRETVFASLGDLKIGDELVVKTSAGSFTYEISGTRIVDKDDKTVIVPTDHAVLTLTTCYPFNVVGTAPDRYIVSADLVTEFNE